MRETDCKGDIIRVFFITYPRYELPILYGNSSRGCTREFTNMYSKSLSETNIQILAHRYL